MVPCGNVIRTGVGGWGGTSISSRIQSRHHERRGSHLIKPSSPRHNAAVSMLLIGRSTNDRKTCESQVVKSKDIGIVHGLAEVRTPVPDCKGIQLDTEYDNRRLSRPSREYFPLAVLIHKQITSQTNVRMVLRKK